MQTKIVIDEEHKTSLFLRENNFQRLLNICNYFVRDVSSCVCFVPVFFSIYFLVNEKLHFLEDYHPVFFNKNLLPAANFRLI